MATRLTPMLCRSGAASIDDLSRYTPDRYAAEIKFDGWRGLAERTLTGDIRLLGGRNGSDYSGQVPYIERALMDALPPGTIVDGEIVGREDRGNVQSAMTTKVPHEVDDLMLVIFDVVKVVDTDVRHLPWYERRTLVETIKTKADQLDVSTLIPAKDGRWPKDMIQMVTDAGFEGIVLKRRISTYSHRRSPDWIKIKPQITGEARVIGFKPGNGALSGLVGALEIEMLETGAKTSCSGHINMALRREITANKDDWMGAIIELELFSIGDSGKPVSPIFVRRRYDLESAPA